MRISRFDLPSRFDISVIIPVFNEKDNIFPLYKKLKETLNRINRSYEIIFVDDGSQDNTYHVLENIAMRDKSIKLIKFSRNYGQTAALSAGFRVARGEVIIPMDGDLQNDPDDIEKLLKQIELGYDIVSGWRRDRKDGISKKIPSKIANWIISCVSGIHIHDYGCTMKAYRRSIIENLRLYGEMHRFIPIYAMWQGGRIAEIEVKHHPRLSGKSKYGLDRTVKVLLDLMVVRFLTKYLSKPIYLFGGFGLLCIVTASVLGGLKVYDLFVNGITNAFDSTTLGVLILLSSGVLSILMGLMAEVMVRTYFESQGKESYWIKELVNFDSETNANYLTGTNDNLRKIFKGIP